MIKLLAVVLGAALVATAGADARVIDRQDVTFRGNRVQARVTLSTYPKAHGRHALYVILRTRRPGGGVFREIALAQLAVSRRPFQRRSFVVEPRLNSAVVKVAWRLRGLVRTHERYLRARADSLRFISPP